MALGEVADAAEGASVGVVDAWSTVPQAAVSTAMPARNRSLTPSPSIPGKMQAAPFSIYVRRAAQVTPTREQATVLSLPLDQRPEELGSRIPPTRRAGAGPRNLAGQLAAARVQRQHAGAEPLSTCHVPSVPRST